MWGVSFCFLAGGHGSSSFFPVRFFVMLVRGLEGVVFFAVDTEIFPIAVLVLVRILAMRSLIARAVGFSPRSLAVDM